MPVLGLALSAGDRRARTAASDRRADHARASPTRTRRSSGSRRGHRNRRRRPAVASAAVLIATALWWIDPGAGRSRSTSSSGRPSTPTSTARRPGSPARPDPRVAAAPGRRLHQPGGLSHYDLWERVVDELAAGGDADALALGGDDRRPRRPLGRPRVLPRVRRRPRAGDARRAAAAELLADRARRCAVSSTTTRSATRGSAATARSRSSRSSPTSSPADRSTRQPRGSRLAPGRGARRVEVGRERARRRSPGTRGRPSGAARRAAAAARRAGRTRPGAVSSGWPASSPPIIRQWKTSEYSGMRAKPSRRPSSTRDERHRLDLDPGLLVDLLHRDLRRRVPDVGPPDRVQPDPAVGALGEQDLAGSLPTTAATAHLRRDVAADALADGRRATPRRATSASASSIAAARMSAATLSTSSKRSCS